MCIRDSFEGMEQLKKDGVQLNKDDYELMYEGEVGEFRGCLLYTSTNEKVEIEWKIWQVNPHRTYSFCALVYNSEILFPKKGVRFIAINNNVHSATPQDNDFTPFLNIMNEWYAKDRCV